uniref:Uncharacterized protein LOC105852190 n=1 Tax=Cicer arietinum TaxID=3827 RepID=A0A1S3E7Q4_CICAR|nr:uncharacterized protein LOC105852190 [Cicer arietinum]
MKSFIFVFFFWAVTLISIDAEIEPTQTQKQSSARKESKIIDGGLRYGSELVEIYKGGKYIGQYKGQNKGGKHKGQNNDDDDDDDDGDGDDSKKTKKPGSRTSECWDSRAQKWRSRGSRGGAGKRKGKRRD